MASQAVSHWVSAICTLPSRIMCMLATEPAVASAVTAQPGTFLLSRLAIAPPSG
jgi:hypothetical protein